MFLLLPDRECRVRLCIEPEALNEANREADLDPAELMMSAYIAPVSCTIINAWRQPSYR